MSARGGFVGPAGRRAPDAVPALLAPGVAFLSERQVAMIESTLERLGLPVPNMVVVAGEDDPAIRRWPR